MKQMLSLIGFVAVLSAVCCANAATGRVGVSGNVASRMPTMAVSPIGAVKTISDTKPKAEMPNTMPGNPSEPEKPAVDTREKERTACISNNIGIGNTFVWASRYSDLNNYATMVEDVENPENNTCFVLVGLRSTDSRIDLSDIPSKYFEMGRDITCGAWADEGKIEQRILDAKKKGRTWATVGGAVGGTALGVGAMELFGNRLIGNDVMGQKAGTVQEQFTIYVSSLDETQKKQLIEYFQEMDAQCSGWQDAYGTKPKECDGLVLDENTTISYSELAAIK